MISTAVFIFCGILSGIFSGLLGIGGGLVIVPLLILVFEHTAQIPAHHIMHVVVATSLSASIFTSFSSAYAQTKRQSVLWDIVKIMSPFIILGTLLGASLANLFSFIPEEHSKKFFKGRLPRHFLYYRGIFQFCGTCRG